MLSKEKERLLSQRIGYEFNNQQLLQSALTHSSYVNERGMDYRLNNERLEFLGDAVLDAVISEYLYSRHTDCEEGFLTKKRAGIVCESSLATCGRSLNLGEYLILGRGEDNNDGRNRASMLADAVEAIIGATYLDGGWEAARTVVIHMLEEVIQMASEDELEKDYKSLLQELYQSSGDTDIRYVVAKEEGPDHDKTFYVDLCLGGILAGQGRGKSKKEAEQQAAKIAYEART